MDSEDSYIKKEHFSDLKRKELDQMQKRPDATGHGEKELVGLAISGGGIRSAIFALGFLQSLAAKDHLKKVDYLSTVSGGGYIGTAFSWLLHRFWEDDDPDKSIRYSAEKSGFPFATSPRDKNRTRNESLINYMRRNRQYLTPGDGIGVFSLLAAILRGIILNALVYLPFIIAVFFALQMLGGMLFSAEDLTRAMTYVPDSVANLVASNTPNWLPQTMLGLLLASGAAAAFAVYLLATISYAFRTIGSRRYRKATYGYRRSYDVYAGKLLMASLGLAVVASVPFVALYLDNPAVTGASAAGTGLLAGYLSFWKSQSKALKILPMPVLVWVGSTALIYGVLLLAILLCKQLTDLQPEWGALEVYKLIADVLALSFLLGLAVDLNAVSLHRFYRDRLMEAFMPDPRKVVGKTQVEDQAELADKAPLSDICQYQEAPDGALGPYHLINTNVILSRSDNKTLRARGGDSFLLSPLYCGSKATGWRRTKEFSGNRVTLPSAMATSGAALNPDTGAGGDGATRNPALSAFMRMLNLRLGYWVPNPERPPGILTKSYRPSLIFEGLMPRNNENANALELSDGGHFDNLGVYELIRREVPFIILLDAAADPKFEFSDFSNLLEKIRADFGVVISNIALQKLMPMHEGHDKLQLSEAGVVSGDIIYGPSSVGKLFYVKTTMIEGLPEDIYGYRRTHPKFPDESTADQFFDEKQFEAYRELGYRLGAKLDELPEFSVVKGL